MAALVTDYHYLFVIPMIYAYPCHTLCQGGYPEQFANDRIEPIRRLQDKELKSIDTYYVSISHDRRHQCSAAYSGS